MIRLSVLYPSSEGATFDHDYYRDTHVPLAMRAWGLAKADIDKGVDGPYVAAVHFEFDSVDALGAAMGAEATRRGPGRRRQLHEHHAGPADERDRPRQLTQRVRVAPSPAWGRWHGKCIDRD